MVQTVQEQTEIIDGSPEKIKKMENQSGSVIGQVFLKTSLLMLNDENAANENTDPCETTPKNPLQKLQEMLAVHDKNTIVTRVSVLLPEKSGPGIEMPEAEMGLLSKNQKSVPSSGFC